MALDVTATLDIPASPAEVAAIQFDPSHDPEWIGGVDHVEHITPPPLRLGGQVRRLGRFMGRQIEWVMLVEAFEPARHVGMRALRSPFPMRVDYSLEPLEGGRATRASIRIRGEGGSMYGLPGVVLGAFVRRSVAADLHRLRSRVQSASC